jgi:DNA-binding GntR family transcriptional regulator
MSVEHRDAASEADLSAAPSPLHQQVYQTLREQLIIRNLHHGRSMSLRGISEMLGLA